MAKKIKLKWQMPDYYPLQEAIIKSGSSYFPGEEGLAAAVTPNAAVCSLLANYPFTQNAAAICAGTATANAGPGAGGAVNFTNGGHPVPSYAQCGVSMVIAGSPSYVYTQWTSDPCAANFNYDLSVNVCSVCL